MPRFDALTFLLASGVMFLAMPLTVWLLLRRRQPPQRLNLWCLSGLAFSLSLVLFGLRAQVPDLLSIHLANALLHACVMLMIAVLRLAGGHAAAWPLLAWALVASELLIVAADGVSMLFRAGTAYLLHALWSLAAGVTAQGLARRHASRSAQWMAVMFAVLGLSMAAQGLSLWLSSDALLIFKPGMLFIVTMLLSLASGVSVNIAFIGLALDQAGARARQQQAALEALRQTQQAMELAARTREAVAGERARTTRLLAHEVRQPLHNASVALQSGAATLANSRNAADAARAIEQAQSVIRRVSTTLDNTVAATTLLATQQRISTADTDLQMLIELCLGDLPPQARARVQIDYRADARSARLEASLMRLALRNLLINATLYAPDPTPVQLRVLDSDTPLALVLEVADLGPGIADELRDRLFDDGVRGAPATVPGYGLGLHVVKRVAQLHGGSIGWLPNQPQGSVFRLTLPQGDPA